MPVKSIFPYYRKSISRTPGLTNHLSRSTHICRRQENMKRGGTGEGGGGLLIFARHVGPSEAGYNAATGVRRELRNCAVTIHPNHSYLRTFRVTWVYRPTRETCLSYGSALKHVMQEFGGRQTTEVAGVLRTTTRGRAFAEWIDEDELLE